MHRRRSGRRPVHATRTRLALALAIVAALVLSSFPARAEPRPELRARLVYSIPPSCPGEQHFLALLATHSAVVIDPAAPLVLRVEVAREQRRHRGRVSLLTTEDEGVREVVADRCEDVVRGLALFSAIALDAWFERSPKEEPAPVPDVAPAPETESPSPSSQQLPRTERVAVPEHRGAPERRVWFGAGLGQHGATTTRLVSHLGVVADLTLPWQPAPTVRLTAAAGAVVPESYRDGTLSLAMAWARLDVCPAWVTLGDRLRASVCPAGEIGLQRAALDAAAVGRSEVRPWAAIGGVARVRVRAGDRLEIVSSAGVVAPLLPFDFRTRTGVAYSTSTVAPVVELDLVVPLF